MGDEYEGWGDEWWGICMGIQVHGEWKCENWKSVRGEGWLKGGEGNGYDGINSVGYEWWGVWVVGSDYGGWVGIAKGLVEPCMV